MSLVEKVRVSFYITHPSADDLVISLSSPTTTEDVAFTLVADADFGTGTADADRTTIDAAASTPLRFEASPRAGTFQPAPEAGLDSFIGDTAAGTWVLRVGDYIGGNVGTLHAASLFVTTGGVESRYDATGLPLAIPDATPSGITVSFAVPPPVGTPHTFVVQITPLIRPDPGFVEEGDIITVAQFADLDVGHAINGFKTARVTLSMHDPVVAGLKPFEFALRILYEDRLEPVFWGQSNLIKDYGGQVDNARGVVHLEAQDPSQRMLHHYLRRGDTALNALDGNIDQGVHSADAFGISLAVEAAQNIASQDARNDPSLGLDVVDESTPVAPVVVVERGQECWQVVSDIADNEVGPEITMDTPDTLDLYAHLVTHDLMGTDRTSATPDTPGAGEVVFDYALGADNIETGPTVTPIPPVTHAHVLSEDRKYRETSAAFDSLGVPTSNLFGVWVRFVRTGFNVSGGDTTVLKEKANAIVRAYGFPLRQVVFALRPDAVIGPNYGRPGFTAPGGTRVATFYLGDFITFRAVEGYCSDEEDMRVTEVHLTWPGWQGPARTVVTVIPRAGSAADDPGADGS